MKLRLYPVKVVVAVLCVFTLAGCDRTNAVDISPSLKAQIDQILADPSSSDFERKVVTDYTITDAEYQESEQLFTQCMANEGWTVVFRDDGGYSVTAAPGNPVQSGVPNSVNIKCEDGTIGRIQPLYLALKYNPQQLSAEQLTRQCFQNNGITDGESLSQDAFAAMVDDPSYTPSSPQAALCVLDPTGMSGLTAQQAEEQIHSRTTLTTSPSATPVPQSATPS